MTVEKLNYIDNLYKYCSDLLDIKDTEIINITPKQA